MPPSSDMSTEASTEDEDVSPPWGTLPTEAYLLVESFEILTVEWAIVKQLIQILPLL